MPWQIIKISDDDLIFIDLGILDFKIYGVLGKQLRVLKLIT